MAAADRRIALVTGATRGIGQAIAEALIRRGLEVIVFGRDVKRGAELARRLGADAAAAGSAGGATFRELDVTDQKSIEATAAWVERTLGGLDILVDNAGATFDGFDAEVARRTLDVNFTGAMLLTDRLLPLLREGARIVMVSSGMGEVSCLGEALREEILWRVTDRASLVAFADRFVADVAADVHRERGWPSNAYRVSKLALNAYTRILARDLAEDPRRILVNAACPGWVRTDMGGPGAPRSPEEGAETPVWLALLPAGDARTGGFYRDERRIAW